MDLVVWQDGQPLRRFTGVVSEFTRGDTGHRRTRYEVVIQPPLWRLGLMHNSRIFQTQTTDTIVRTLLEERGIVDTVFDLKRPPEEREYCVQHRESDLQFIERLAAEEGWHYRYQHGSVDGEVQPALILADHHGDAPKLDPVTCNTGPVAVPSRPACSGFAYQERVKAASVAMKDYTFKNPAYALMHEHSAGGVNHREDYQHYDYPGRYKADASGQPFTQSQTGCPAETTPRWARAKATARTSPRVPRWRCKDHDNQGLNREWLLTAITHTGKQPQALEEEGGSEPTSYHNDFSAIPADKTWRPVCDHKPLMDGPQMAIVTGPEGEEIHCDRYGRVKVRFPWDPLRPASKSNRTTNTAPGCASLRAGLAANTASWRCRESATK